MIRAPVYFYMSYEKLSKIGQGTYGVVYKAQNTQNKEIVALKKIKFESHEEGLPSSAIREIALLKELDHPYIIKLYNVLHLQQRLTLIFEFCEWDLTRYMKTLNNCLPKQQILSFSYQLLSALSYIHEKSIIHRDIKPQNLLINRKLELKLADFGLARSTFIPIGMMSTEVITQWYRPPEILLNIADYASPVDIWSAGCVIVEMLSGQPLFPCHNNEEMINVVCKLYGYETLLNAFPEHEQQLNASRSETGIGIRNYLQEYDDDIVDLVSKLLEPNPKKRITANSALNHPIFKNIILQSNTDNNDG